MTSASGWLALLLLCLAALSGALLSWHFQPSDVGAYASVVGLENTVRGGAWLRSLHFFSTQLGLGLALLHFVAVLVARRAPAPSAVVRPERTEQELRLHRGASAGGEQAQLVRAPRPGAGFTSGLLALVLTALAAFSGRVLPWDQHGGLSLTMLGEFFRVGGLDPVGGLLADSSLRVQRVFLLHLLGTLLLGIALGVHLLAPARMRLRGWLADPRQGRWVGRATLGALGVVLALASLAPAPLGPPFALPTLSADSAISAEWYLRWLQYLSLRSIPVARIALLTALALVLAAPLYGRRLGLRGLRILWGGVLLLGVVVSLLPAGPS